MTAIGAIGADDLPAVHAHPVHAVHAHPEAAAPTRLAQLTPIRTELTMMSIGVLFVLFAAIYGISQL